MDALLATQHFVELRLLRYVIAVAEELHFGRAAKRLHLSPPTLSKQVKDLEGNLGYKLFERKTREVLVTPAGIAFVTEARQSLAHAQRAVECGSAASRGDSGVFSLGYSPWFRPSLLVKLQAAFAEKLPKTRLGLHSAYSATQIELILKGTLQAGIIELPVNGEGLETHCIWHDELVVVVPEAHPLANQPEIGRQDLIQEPIIWIARSLHPALHRYFLDSCQQLGFLPRITHEVNSVSELLDLVEAGTGIGFIKRSIAARVQASGVAFRELGGAKLFIDTGIVFRPDNESEALRVLMALLREQNS